VKDPVPSAWPTGDPAHLRQVAGTCGEAEQGVTLRAAGRKQWEQARSHHAGAAQRARCLPWEENPPARHK